MLSSSSTMFVDWQQEDMQKNTDELFTQLKK